MGQVIGVIGQRNDDPASQKCFSKKWKVDGWEASPISPVFKISLNER